VEAPGDLVPSVFDETGEIVSDVACRRCGYNLRGLREDGCCPECGTPIGLSTRGDLLRFANPAWAERLALGIKYILWGLIISIVVGAVGGCATGVLGGNVALLHVVSLLAGLIGVYGAWLLTSPDPSGIGEDRHVTARKIVRFALLVGLLGECLQIVQTAATTLPSVATILLLLLAGLAGLVGVVGEIAKYFYLEKLADRIPNPKLAGQARFLRWALGVTFGLGAVLGTMVAISAVVARAPGAAPPGGRLAALVAPGAPAPATQPASSATGAPNGTSGSQPAVVWTGRPVTRGPVAFGGGGPATPTLTGMGRGGLIATVVVGAVLGLALLIFQVMAFVLQVRLGRRFREQADIARQTWAAVVDGGKPPPPAELNGI